MIDLIALMVAMQCTAPCLGYNNMVYSRVGQYVTSRQAESFVEGIAKAAPKNASDFRSVYPFMALKARELVSTMGAQGMIKPLSEGGDSAANEQTIVDGWQQWLHSDAAMADMADKAMRPIAPRVIVK